MRIFAFEYVTAGGWRDIGASASLVAEGAMMLGALVRDLASLPGVSVVVAHDPETGRPPPGATPSMTAPGDRWGAWRAIAERCDAVWPIAPETGGVLEDVTAMAIAAGRIVLNSRGAALAICRSKQATARELARHGIPVVPTLPLGAPPPTVCEGWVVKPDDGAGAADTLLVSDRAILDRCVLARNDGRHVLQPYVAGEPLSVSLLAQDGAGWLLSCNRQRVAVADATFRYCGGIVAGAEDRRAVLTPLVQRIAAALPELWGYVGVDLVDGPQGPMVLEINPRLTTSYVGLADSISINPAGLVLALLEHRLTELMRPLAPRAIDVAVPVA